MRLPRDSNTQVVYSRSRSGTRDDQDVAGSGDGREGTPVPPLCVVGSDDRSDTVQAGGATFDGFAVFSFRADSCQAEVAIGRTEHQHVPAGLKAHAPALGRGVTVRTALRDIDIRRRDPQQAGICDLSLGTCGEGKDDGDSKRHSEQQLPYPDHALILPLFRGTIGLPFIARRRPAPAISPAGGLSRSDQRRSAAPQNGGGKDGDDVSTSDEISKAREAAKGIAYLDAMRDMVTVIAAAVARRDPEAGAYMLKRVEAGIENPVGRRDRIQQEAVDVWREVYVEQSSYFRKVLKQVLSSGVH